MNVINDTASDSSASTASTATKAGRSTYTFRVPKPAAGGPSTRTKMKGMVSKILLWYQFRVSHGSTWGLNYETVSVDVDDSEGTTFKRGMYSLTLQAISHPPSFLPLMFADVQHPPTFSFYWKVPYPSHLSFRTLYSMLSSVVEVVEVAWSPDLSDDINSAYFRPAPGINQKDLLSFLHDIGEWRTPSIFGLRSGVSLTEAECRHIVADIKGAVGRTNALEVSGKWMIEIGTTEQGVLLNGLEVEVAGKKEKLVKGWVWNEVRREREVLAGQIDNVFPIAVHPHLPPINLSDPSIPLNLKKFGYSHPTAFTLALSTMLPPGLISPGTNATASTAFTGMSLGTEHENPGNALGHEIAGLDLELGRGDPMHGVQAWVEGVQNAQVEGDVNMQTPMQGGGAFGAFLG